MNKEEYNEWFMSELIGQLAASERFQQFVKMNYDIKQVIDDGAKEARLQVIEVPHEIAAKRIQEAAREKMGEQGGIEVVSASALDKLSKP